MTVAALLQARLSTPAGPVQPALLTRCDDEVDVVAALNSLGGASAPTARGPRAGSRELKRGRNLRGRRMVCL